MKRTAPDWTRACAAGEGAGSRAARKRGFVPILFGAALRLSLMLRQPRSPATTNCMLHTASACYRSATRAAKAYLESNSHAELMKLYVEMKSSELKWKRSERT